MRMRQVGLVLVLAACSGSDHAGDQIDGGSSDADAAVVESPEPGLRGEYFASYHQRVVERVDPTIDFAWGDGEMAPGTGVDHVSVRWSGFLDVPAAGTYTFVTSNDDGVRVRIGDTLVIDDWNFHYPEHHDGTIALDAGKVPIVVEYFEIDLGAEMHLSWS